MRKPDTRAPAGVDRRFADSRNAERAAAAGIILLMAALFWFMPGRSADAGATSVLAELDLREVAPAPSATERTGRVTDTVTATDALEVLGATAGDAARHPADRFLRAHRR